MAIATPAISPPPPTGITAASRSGTTDQMLFNIMERKYNINEKLNNIIKESSVDCLKHTTDDPILNNKCIQFSSKLQNEIIRLTKTYNFKNNFDDILILILMTLNY